LDAAQDVDPAETLQRAQALQLEEVALGVLGCHAQPGRAAVEAGQRDVGGEADLPQPRGRGLLHVLLHAALRMPAVGSVKVVVVHPAPGSAQPATWVVRKMGRVMCPIWSCNYSI